jgi:hypothetical protein
MNKYTSAFLDVTPYALTTLILCCGFFFGYLYYQNLISGSNEVEENKLEDTIISSIYQVHLHVCLCRCVYLCSYLDLLLCILESNEVKGNILENNIIFSIYMMIMMM